MSRAEKIGFDFSKACVERFKALTGKDERFMFPLSAIDADTVQVDHHVVGHGGQFGTIYSIDRSGPHAIFKIHWNEPSVGYSQVFHPIGTRIAYLGCLPIR